MRSVPIASLMIATLATTAATAVPSVTTVMSGLDNPRGLAFGPEGALYVAETGRGGAGPCVTLRDLLSCYGPTGAVSRLWRGQQTRFATGLPSMINPIGEASGPQDIAFLGRGNAFVTIGWAGADPILRAGFGPAGAQFGTLMRINAHGSWSIVADLAAYESAFNPADGPLESNPYGVLAEPAARIATDAAGNSLLRIKANGEISTLATFPSRPARPTDAVPTSVVRGPDGAYYVSELSGVPFADGAARIYRVVPGNEPEVFLEGFKTVIDMEFGKDGSLYVLQHATGPVFFAGPGQVIRVTPDGARSVVVGNLNRPTSVTLGPDSALYVTNQGVSVGTGEVLRVVP